MKNIRLWLAVVFGTSFSFLFNQYVLSKLWSFESLRFQIASYLSIILFSVICFWLLELVLAPRFQMMAKAQRSGVVLVSLLLLPMILAISVLKLEELLTQNIDFLLPAHAVEIQALPRDEQKQADVALAAFFTEAQGHIRFNTLETKGWDRVGDELILTDLDANQIKWRGKTGEKAFLVFKSRTDSAQIIVSWDDAASQKHVLSPDNSRGIRIPRNFEIPFYADWPILILAIYLSIAFGSFAVSVLFVAFPGFVATAPAGKGTWLIHALPMYLIWSIYLLTFWPGFMSADSMSQWSQVVTGKFVHANPVGHTLTMWLITRLWFSPAAIALVQIAALGAVLGWGIATIRKFGAPAWLAWLTTIALALSPANSFLSITLWKDILFSVVVAGLTVIVFRIVVTQGRWLDQKTSWVSLGIMLTLVSLYRLNGFFVAGIVLLLIVSIYRSYWRPLLRTTVLFLAVYVLFTGVIFRILSVRIVDMARDELVIAQLLAGHMQVGSISAEDQEILKPALQEYPWPYRCYRNSPFIFIVDRHYLIEHSREISDIALRATQQNPMETLRHFACQGASVYRIPQEYRNELFWFGIFENDYGIKQTSLLPRLFPILKDSLEMATAHPIVLFAWRMPFWMYLSVFTCIVFCIRSKTWRPFLILIPGLLAVLPYIILTLGQIFRYVYSMYLIGILLSGYFLLCAFPKEDIISENID